LLTQGTPHLAEIGFHNGVYVVLAIYQGRADATVRYSAGCSASFSARTALVKALAELQQGYMFFEWRKRVRGASAHAHLADRIDRDNAPDTWRTFSFLGAEPTISAADFAQCHRGNQRILLDQFG
jgi:ribosomal protein S12 methylthiotransferase accessory factor YcaO